MRENGAANAVHWWKTRPLAEERRGRRRGHARTAAAAAAGRGRFGAACFLEVLQIY